MSEIKDLLRTMFGRYPRPWRIDERDRKYYGTRVLDADGTEVMNFWTAEGEPSEREKRRFGSWTPEAWAEYCCDSHWECEADHQAALALIRLSRYLDAHKPAPWTRLEVEKQAQMLEDLDNGKPTIGPLGSARMRIDMLRYLAKSDVIEP